MRLEITRRADLAVQAMVALASSQRRWKAPELAEHIGTTTGFVPQVVGPLVKAGWVRSDPGPTGGYVSTAGLTELSVLEVIESVDGSTDSGRCVVADRPCNADQPCTLHVAWAVARQQLIDVLATTSLDDVARSGNPVAH